MSHNENAASPQEIADMLANLCDALDRWDGFDGMSEESPASLREIVSQIDSLSPGIEETLESIAEEIEEEAQAIEDAR